MDKTSREELRDLKNKNNGSDIKKKIGIIIKNNINRMKENIEVDNYYRKYIVKNKSVISAMCSYSLEVSNYKEAISLIGAVDIRKFFDIDVDLNMIFQNKVFYGVEEVDGEIYTDEDKMKRAINGYGKEILNVKIINMRFNRFTYYAKYKVNKNNTYINKINDKYYMFFKRLKNEEEEKFDLINLYEIIMTTPNTITAINELCDILNIKIKYVEQQKDKYYSNKLFLSTYLETEYKILSKYINKYRFVLDELLEQGEKNIYMDEYSFKGENVFFAGSEYIRDILNKKNENNKMIRKIEQDKVTRAINVFCTLGFIEKLKKEDVPIKMQKNNYEYKKGLNYYIVYKYNHKLFENAEKRVLVLKENKISLTKFGEKSCMKLFGEEVTNMVFRK
ncbi:hypothetical protein CM240_1263 [Clostridium bornimense]|uniref:Uncharacterized protein n=1 Tax=Clostridium bornimense TaxID=1216932 RepID=W6S2B5_9CLOT|nr:hypothetical protein [Clostridium bornimense]CDM68427.1 hypothetical protein CM240_1263 [Clostridium bornimense]